MIAFKNPPMKTYIFEIKYGRFRATVGFVGEYTLYDLAETLIEAVGFDFDHCFEFCDNLGNPYDSKERYTLFADIGEADDDPGVKKTLISQVFTEGRSMLFHFDYGDDWEFPVTCTDIGEEEEATRRYRKVLSRRGTPPIQYPPDEEE
jgi:Plasmid pRiA4b ORF-3-like protein